TLSGALILIIKLPIQALVNLTLTATALVSVRARKKPPVAHPPLLRAQTSAASLTAALEVLSRFVALTLQTGPRSPLEAQITDLVGRAAPQPAPAQQRPAPSTPTPMASKAAPARRGQAPPAPAFE